MPNFVEYDDDDLHMVVPDDLKQKKPPARASGRKIPSRAFMRPKNRWKNPGILTICVTLPTSEEWIQSMRRGFVLTSPTKEWEWEGVTHTAIRVGKCAQGREDAVEALSTSSNAITGDVFYFYNTLFTDNEL